MEETQTHMWGDFQQGGICSAKVTNVSERYYLPQDSAGGFLIGLWLPVHGDCGD